MNRRQFMTGILGSAALLSLDKVLARPYDKLLLFDDTPRVKVSGRVMCSGKGVDKVTVSDGVTCTRTGNDGSFSFVSSAVMPFVFISIPSGYILPRSLNGTAGHWQLMNPNKSGESLHQFELIQDSVNRSNHSFFALADPQILDADDMKRFHNETIQDVKMFAAEAAFGISVGDIMFDNLSLYPEYIEGIAKTGLPFFQAVGNHDVDANSASDDASVATFSRYFGPNRYSFNAGEVHYVVLDSVFTKGKEYIGYITDTQLEWLRQDLRFVQKGSTVVVFMHIPPYTTRHIRNNKPKPTDTYAVSNREELYSLLGGYNTTIICGHTHESDLLTDGGCTIHTLGTACGAWWTSDICYDGTPNGYGYYSVRGSELELTYKATGKPADYQCRSYGTDDRNNFSANIWSVQPGDTVVLMDGDEMIGEMKNITCKDPLAAELFTGKDKPVKHGWVEPVNQMHLYSLQTDKKLVRPAIELRNKLHTRRIKV